jgi:hypothetical protein
MVGIAHAVNCHNVRASPQRPQPHIFFGFVDDVLQPFVVSQGYVENIGRHFSAPWLVVVMSGFKPLESGFSFQERT